ncbi:MAG: hypothetical protein ACJ8AB_11750 [Gemmatimonadaceae bacterium]
MRLSKVIAAAPAMATIVVAARCAPVQSQSKPIDAEKVVMVGPPVIESARPDSVVLPYGGVVEVTLTGTGFVPGQPGRNTVHFGGAMLASVPASADGRQILFAIPEVISFGGGAPPSNLRAGSYSVSVETSAGKSNAVKVRVYR